MEIKVFENESFGSIRTAGTSDEPLFLANDLCKALGYARGAKAASDHCDEEDVLKRDTLTRGGMQSMTFVNESGMYTLIFGSNLPQAKAFKRWVTSEVLPSIRKTGSYSVSREEHEKVVEQLESSVADNRALIYRNTEHFNQVEKLLERYSYKERVKLEEEIFSIPPVSAIKEWMRVYEWERCDGFPSDLGELHSSFCSWAGEMIPKSKFRLALAPVADMHRKKFNLRRVKTSGLVKK